MTDDILSRLTRILTEEFDVSDSSIQLDAKLAEDLRLDSVEAVEFVFDIEDEFGIEVTDDEVLGVQTLRDLVDAVTAKVAAKEPPS